MTKTNHVCVGVISSPHGVRGAFKVKCFTEIVDNIFTYGTLYDEAGDEVDITPIGQSGGALTAKISGVEDRDEAERLKGKKLYVPREAMPSPDEDEFYIEDLIGLTVKIADGREVGTIRQIANYGAGDVIEVQFNNGTEEMYLFNEITFPTIEIEQGYVELNAPEVLEAKK